MLPRGYCHASEEIRHAVGISQTGARKLTTAATINGGAQWLSDHSLMLTFALAACAFAAEGGARYVARDKVLHADKPADRDSPLPKSQAGLWADTWLTNLLLLAATLAVSWAISPWLSPLLSNLLRGRAGLLSLLDLPHMAQVLIGFVLLDLTAFALHCAAHRFGWLWRLHHVHHSDAAMNASTLFRQHPLLIIIALAAQLPVLWALGIPAASWVLYASISMAVQLWHHSHAAAPGWVERALGWWLVTPGFHRLHHHPDRAVHDQNYGAVFSFWDRLFGTRNAETDSSAFVLSPTGLDYVPAKDSASFFACLIAPFQSPSHTQNNAKSRPRLSRRTSPRSPKLNVPHHRKIS